MHPFSVISWQLVVLFATVPAGLSDRGVYSDLDAKVSLALPSWVSAQNLRLFLDRDHRVATVLDVDQAIKSYPISPSCDDPTLSCLGARDEDRVELARLASHAGSLSLASGVWRDSDADGIPDPVDILIGAKKTVLLATPYVETSRKLPFPGGDMPTNEGVCTDVVVRALRNAGIDLQKEIYEDAGRAPKDYPGIDKRNSSIDHRRVRNLLVYFGRHFRKLAPEETLLPGDIAFLDTFPSRPGVEHVGIVSDRLGKSGKPLIINAWTNGYRTSEMDLLGFVAAPAVFRAPGNKRAAATAISVASGFHLPRHTRQVVVSVSNSWAATRATLSWWRRDSQGKWRREGGPVTAMVGSAGMGWGRGLLPDNVPASQGGPLKQEGDDRAPAGVFLLSEALGYTASAATRLPYRQSDSALRCVDDQASPDYNQLRELPATGQPTWKSAETMQRSDGMYALAIVVGHNRAPVVPGAGSCIFIHPWTRPGMPSPGCTMLAPADVKRLVRWLDPAAKPVLVQLPQGIYAKGAQTWGFPVLSDGSAPTRSYPQ